jgi:hypothetical protein
VQHRIKSEAHVPQRRASLFGTGERNSARAAPTGLLPTHSNSDANGIDADGGNKRAELLEELEIREREEAVRQKQIQTVQMQIDMIMPIISSEKIPDAERAQLRKCLYAKLAEAGLTDLNIIPESG